MKHITKQAGETSVGKAHGLFKFVTVAMFAISLGGCAGDGMDLSSAYGPDTSIKTASSGGKSDRTPATDEVAVKNAIVAANLETLGNNPLPWANASTGTAGVASQISEVTDKGTVCRDFTTTSHSYDGVAKYSGRTCMLPGGEWYIVRFDKQG